MNAVSSLKQRARNRGLALVSKWLRLEVETFIAKLQNSAAHPMAQDNTEAALIKLLQGCRVNISLYPLDPKDLQHAFVQVTIHRSGEDNDPS